MDSVQPLLQHLYLSILLQSSETWLENKLQQIGVCHDTGNNHVSNLYVLAWCKKEQYLSFFFFRLGSGWRFVFFVYVSVYLSEDHLFKGITFLYTNSGLFVQSFQEKKSVDEISSHLIYPSQLFHVNEEMEVFVSHQSCEINARLAAWKCWNPLALILE